MTKEFEGKVAIVTGGASGIGAATVEQLAAAGAKVVVADLNIDLANELAAKVKAAGGEASAFKIDVGSLEANEALVEFAVSTYGALHLAVNNAGIGGPAALTADYPLDAWQKVIDINLNSVFYGLKAELPAILKSGGGSIVNVASILGTNGFAQSPAYVAAKHGVVGLTKTAAIEYSAKGVRINSVGPGFIDTPLLRNTPNSAKDHLVSLHPIGRLGTSDEVAALIVFLLSDKASFITGSYHLVDGAYSSL